MALADALGQLCRLAVQRLPVRGAAVHLMTEQHVAGVAAASDKMAAEVAELPFLTGVGPCLDAFRLGRPVLVPDLSTLDTRWPGYASTMRGRGVAAVFSLPLQDGAVRLGVLELYADEAGPLDDEHFPLAVAMARVATELLLTGDGIEEVLEVLDVLVDDRSEIYQAQGAVTVALEVSLAEAMVRLRAHAFSLDVPLLELARLVLSGSSPPETW